MLLLKIGTVRIGYPIQQYTKCTEKEKSSPTPVPRDNLAYQFLANASKLVLCILNTCIAVLCEGL